MKKNQIKFTVVLIFSFLILLIVIFQQNTVTGSSAADDTAAEYKKACSMCHTAKAEKFFDPSKSDNDYIQAILKGKKGEKPPLMPGFEEKGMTPELAKDLAVYMRRLRICECNSETNAANSNAPNAVNAIANTNTTVSNSTETVDKPVISEEIMASYKKNCSVCHSPKAEKFFDATKPNAVLEETVLNGKKGEKPPYMPEYKSKGFTAEQVKALVAYMQQLKTAN